MIRAFRVVFDSKDYDSGLERNIWRWIETGAAKDGVHYSLGFAEEIDKEKEEIYGILCEDGQQQDIKEIVALLKEILENQKHHDPVISVPYYPPCGHYDCYPQGWDSVRNLNHSSNAPRNNFDIRSC